MLKIRSISSLLLIPLVASCVVSHPVAPCPKPPVIPAELTAPAPAATLFPQCLNDLLQPATSVQGLPSSCKQLQDWLSSNQNGNTR